MSDKGNNSMSNDKEKNLKCTPERIVIKANLQNYTFPKETYKTEYISHLIPKDQYDLIIEKASKILSQAWMKKRENDKINLPGFVTGLSVLSVILTIAYMIMIYYSTTVKDGTALLVVSIICVIIATAIAFGLSIYNFCRKMGTFKTVQEIIREDLLELFSGINQQYFDRLEFSFNDEGNYLEIKIKQPNPRLNIHNDDDVEILENNKEDERQNIKKDAPGTGSRPMSNKNSKVISRQLSNKDVELEMTPKKN